MSETANELRKKGRALYAKGQRVIAEAEALFARANMLDENGRTQLQNAILAGKKAEAKALIRAGADPNETGKTDDRPPLALALGEDEKEFHASLAMALIKAGADPNAMGEAKRAPPLVWALLRGEKYSEPLVMALIKAGADPNAKAIYSSSERTVLRLALKQSDLDAALALLKAGANPKDHDALEVLEKEVFPWLSGRGSKIDAKLEELRVLLGGKP